jgi:hypothetical protein
MKKKAPALPVKEALHLFHQDGAVDIIAGATLLNFGFDVLSQSESTSLFTWVPILLLSSLKNKNTLPKLASYFGGVSENQLKRWTFVPALMMILTLVLLGMVMLTDPLKLAEADFLPIAGDLKSFTGFMLIALVCLVPALWAGLKQFFVYSAVAFAGGVASFFFLPAAWSIFIVAAVMLALGERMMIRFSRQYTLPEEKDPEENTPEDK